MASAALFLNATQDAQQHHHFDSLNSSANNNHHASGSTSATTTPSDIHSMTDDELKERLHFIREIGYGNWGSVWACFTKDSPTREKVAVKLVHRSKTPTTAARVKSLWNEMKIHRSFRQDSHPSIVSFHSFTITPSFALITMDYLPRLIPVEVHETKARGWFESLLGGVHFLHRHRVSHNDIKPANILLNATCIPVLVDFGFAEHYSTHKTPRDKMFLSNLAYGTPEYLSPERAKGLVHDTRLSDMWSLGVTFFEILIGRTPFELVEGEAFETQEDLERYWKRTKEGEWLGAEEWQKRISSGMQSLLRRMMSPDVKRRIKAGEALADPYWTSEPYPFGADDGGNNNSSIHLASPPGIFTTPRHSAMIPTFEAELKAVESTPQRVAKQHLQQQQQFTTPTKPPRSPVTPAKKTAGKNRKEKPANTRVVDHHHEPSEPRTPAKTHSRRAAAVRSSPPSHPSFLAAAKAPAVVPQHGSTTNAATTRPGSTSGIPVAAKRKPLATTVINGTNLSNKENAPASSARAAAGKKKAAAAAAAQEDDSPQVNVHMGKKVPARKPIPAGLASLPKSSAEPKNQTKGHGRTTAAKTGAKMDDVPAMWRDGGSARASPSVAQQITSSAAATAASPFGSDTKRAPLSVGGGIGGGGGSTALAMVKKIREEKEKLKSAAAAAAAASNDVEDPSLMMSLELNRSLVQSLICPSPEAKRRDSKSGADAAAAAGDRSGSALAESPSGPSVVPRRDPPKSVLELVKEAKASMNERARTRQQHHFQLQEESMIAEPTGSVNDFDISGSYFAMESSFALPSPSVADLSIAGPGDLPRPLFQSDTFPRSAKDSTSASIIFKQSLRMSMDKLGSKMSSAVGASKHSRAVSVQEIRSSFDTARENAMTPTLDGPERRSADSEADRMTLWLRSIERVVEETRTGFQSGNAQVPVSPTRLPSLPPRITQVSPSKRSSNKVHPVLMVDSPSGRRRRATVGGSSAPEFIIAQEGRPPSPTKGSLGSLTSLNRSVSMRVQGRITPVANLEQELMRSQSPAPQRLSAVIDPADFSAELMRMQGQALPTETSAPPPLLPAVTISQRTDVYSRPDSPTSSLSDKRRKSRSSILLMDRLGVPSPVNMAASTSSVNFGATTVEGSPVPRSSQSSPKDYERLLMSTSGVSRLGQGYQSDRCTKRKSTLESKTPSPPQARPVPSTPQPRKVPSTPSTKFNRKSLFGSRTGTNKSAEPVINRSTSTTFKVATGKLVKSFDDLGGKKASQPLAGTRLKTPQNTPSPKAPTTEKTDSVTGRMRKALQNILSTPRRSRTFTTQQGF